MSSWYAPTECHACGFVWRVLDPQAGDTIVCPQCRIHVRVIDVSAPWYIRTTGFASRPTQDALTDQTHNERDDARACASHAARLGDELRAAREALDRARADDRFARDEVLRLRAALEKIAQIDGCGEYSECDRAGDIAREALAGKR